MAPQAPWWPKLELKIRPHLAESIEKIISSRIFIPKEPFEPYNHLELTQPPSSDLTQPPSSALTQPLSSKLKVLDENGLQI